jgi:23S rRNA pseudouridine2604 synthase
MAQKNESSISLNKFISDTGYCSRREADNLILEGRVVLNKEIARLGNRYNPGDEVEVDGSLITNNQAKKIKRIYLAFNKPAGITCTTDEQIAGNIISFINYPKRIFPIGRLDKDSEGLIFLTNDGDIVNKILRASNDNEKEYIVRVDKPVTPYFVDKMKQGLPILGTVTKPCRVNKIGTHVFSIILTQGLNRQIRRMCECLEYKVISLKRIRIMNVSLDKIPVGKWRYLSEPEMQALQGQINNASNNQTPAPARKHKKDN